MVGRIEHVLQSLGQAKVRFLVVGGVAVVLQGHLRTTLDLDLVVQLDPENLGAALRTLGDLGFRPQAPVALDSFAVRTDLPPEPDLSGWDFEGTRRHHLDLGLEMTPAQRLRWLEETMEEMRRLQGLARPGHSLSP